MITSKMCSTKRKLIRSIWKYIIKLKDHFSEVAIYITSESKNKNITNERIQMTDMRDLPNVF